MEIFFCSLFARWGNLPPLDGSLGRKSGTPQSLGVRDQSASRVADMLQNDSPLGDRGQPVEQITDVVASPHLSCPLADLDMDKVTTYFETALFLGRDFRPVVGSRYAESGLILNRKQVGAFSSD